MRKAQKKVLGFLGLGLVASMTVFAASIPSPEASARTSNVTDSIVVTVKAPEYVADVNFLDHKEDVSYVLPNQDIRFNYSGVEEVTITLEYTDVNNNTSLSAIYNQTVDVKGGSETLPLDLTNYGYGKFKLSMKGSGKYGNDQDVVQFSYVPVTATVEEEDEEVYSILEYDENNVDIDHFVIYIYNSSGEKVGEVPRVDKPTKKVKLPFAENNLQEGEYTISALAIDANGKIIYKSFDTVFKYKPFKAPNTGGLFSGLNISKTDYLITGLIVFAVVGIGGVVFIMKGKNSRRR